ncbi:MAG: hypothetical protein K2G53_01300, partial [Muribaculaceae bacterium]|nr:hypothetical protein [Muribaculaceae bacterium]
MTTALDKNYIEPENDSLIKIALDYYCGQQNSSEMRSLYLYAIILYNKDSFKEALPYASLAYEMATEQKDWFYAGMSGRLLTNLYKFLEIFSEEKRYAIFSRDAFLKYEKDKGLDNRYSSWMTYRIVEALVNNKEYSLSLDVCNSIDADAIANNENLRHELWITKAEALFRLGHPERSLVIYDSLINDGYSMEGYDWTLLAIYQSQVGDFVRAKIALDSAKTDIKFPQDTINIAYLEYILTDPTDKQAAILKLQNYSNEIAKDSEKVIANSPLPNMTESYNKRSEEYKQHIRKQKFRLYTSLAIA